MLALAALGYLVAVFLVAGASAHTDPCHPQHACVVGFRNGSEQSGGGIAFVRGYRVFFMDADGTRQRRTRIPGAPGRLPVWSSNGRRMVFSSSVDAVWRLVVARGDGSHWRTIVRTPRGSERCLIEYGWSPSGKRLAYSDGCDFDFRTIFLINRDGSGRRRLIRHAWLAGPRWAPDGRTILFAYSPVPRDGFFLFRARPDGRNLRKIPGTAVDAGATFSDWEWSHDGKRIFLVDGRNNRLTVVRPDGSDRHVISGGLKVGEFSLSPDGRRIALMAAIGNSDWEIYAMDADGSSLRQLTDNRTDDAEPQWSPDGRRIAFTSDRDGNDEIYLMNADGTDQTNLTQDPADDSTPRWMPVR